MSTYSCEIGGGIARLMEAARHAQFVGIDMPANVPGTVMAGVSRTRPNRRVAATPARTTHIDPQVLSTSTSEPRMP